MKRLPILIAAVVVAAGIGATAFYALRESGGTSAQAPDEVTSANQSLSHLGLPTLPAGSALLAPTTEPTTGAISDATAHAIATETLGGQHLRCGPVADRAGTIARNYGVIRTNCARVGDYLVVITDGDPISGARPALAVYQCDAGDEACRSNGEPRRPGTWAVHELTGPWGPVELIPPDKIRVITGHICVELATFATVSYGQCQPSATDTPTPTGAGTAVTGDGLPRTASAHRQRATTRTAMAS